MIEDPVHAANRFGFGAGPSVATLVETPGAPPAPPTLSRPARPRAGLRAQLAPADPVLFPDSLPTAAEALTLLREQHRLKLPPGESLVRPLFRADAQAQLATVLRSPAPFRERLVWFWANHFTVSVRRGDVRPLVGCFQREAIRPHVCGRFGDMLLAVMRHPAMLLYLDNAGSVGPDSPAGRRRDRGLNENLARESLELHTLGVKGGYSQADVTSYAAILSGWSLDRDVASPGFAFHDRAHEPGPKQLLGRTFPEGEAGGILALDMLARHPATYGHLATKLATHFVSDAPPPEAVAALHAVLVRTDGDLGAVSAALLDLPGCWQPGGTKFRTPFDFAAASLRALPDRGTDGDLRDADRLLDATRRLGQPLWEAPLPNGWSDRAADWATPDAMMARIDWSFGLGGRHAGDPAPDADAVARTSLGARLRPDTELALSRAGDRRDALTLLLSSPEFQRR